MRAGQGISLGRMDRYPDMFDYRNGRFTLINFRV